MWDSRYRREESSDGFQLSPCLTASSGLLTPPSTYSIDARRGSTASTMSSLGPSTPVYGRNPFTDHSYVNVAAMDHCTNQAMEPLTMDYAFKAPGTEGTSYDTWPTFAQPESVNHTIPMRVHHGYASHPSIVPSQMTTYAEVNNLASSAPGPSSNPFSTVPYNSFDSHMSDEADNVTVTGEPMQTLWSYQYALSHMMAPPTMVPTEALLGGEYVHVDQSNQDVELGSYDDVDVPIVAQPQDVTVKQEDLETSEDERRMKRSIWVSSTGGKSVKKEPQAGLSRKKSRKSRSKAITRLHGDRYEIWMDDDVEQIPGTKKWRRNGGGSSGKPQVCGIQVGGMPCGKKFQRQEHLHRHMKTHSGRKDYVCQLCHTQFNRNDNCWEHYWTHVHRPGKKNGRNKKRSLRRVLTYITDPKHAEKLLNKWKKEVGYEYDPNNDPHVQEDESDDDVVESPAAVKEEGPQTPTPVSKQQMGKIRCRL